MNGKKITECRLLISIIGILILIHSCNQSEETEKTALGAVTSTGDSVSLYSDGTWHLNRKSDRSNRRVARADLSTIEHLGSDRISAVIREIIDGDTYEVELIDPPAGLNSIETIRLLGINTPEMGKQEHFAFEAKEYVVNNVLEGEITLAFGAISRDSFCRLLAYVYLCDGTMLNRVLLEKGYARIYSKSTHALYDQFLELQDYAISHMEGLWAETPSQLHIIYIYNYGKEEYLAIMNASDDEIDLSEWQIVDKSGSTIDIPKGIVLKKNAIVRIYSGVNGIHNPPNELYYITDTIWNNDGDEAFLLDSSGEVIDTYIY